MNDETKTPPRETLEARESAAAPGMRWRPYHWLALVPTLGMLGGLPFANRVHPFVLGLPFLFAWLVGWLLATSAIMGVILVLDEGREGREARDAREARAGSAAR